ncbi:hypothetical protein OG887_44435 (plasmid) [Streptomyces sp. NBC_00053]|uniref:hypothetical protein n=1 Tax=unclassified Streptomyces TaxID=2593676 RepID=UPI000F5BE134|nr:MULTISPECIES: hypothetical protein [unclassified Streptomyces]MCX4399966.1 hypothetical protein [Streptomyces sp. NBC_01767]MCX4851840.1 hypothetical protein [Streptomyces sp. NBC_00893]MCX5106912.1 hypothetical protein [Streptomyces sp. NBC_00439]MCX5506031.1 hypothetical protein [Streptomyces sp. NBC_00052]MCX5554314.1 hypothetical protein [Streptomyces sp. NBC_00051]
MTARGENFLACLSPGDADFGRHHADCRPGWNEALDRSENPRDWTQDMLRVAARGGFRNDFLAGKAQGQISPGKGDQMT